MAASIEKTYADALFSVLVEAGKEYQPGLELELKQLGIVRDAVAETPEFIKLLDTPTVSVDEKLSIVEKAFKSTTTDYVYNFLRVLTVKGRMSYFRKIYNEFKILYNEQFNIADIVVTTSVPLTDVLREKIVARMSQITGKTVSLTEKTDKNIIGGIVIDHGTTRLDGSVKTRLAELKKDISGIIA